MTMAMAMAAALRRSIVLVALGGVIAGLSCAGSAPEATPAKGAPSPAVAPAAGGAVREVVVGPEQVECTGAAPQRCLVVDGELFYDAIEGFRYEAGYRYRLRIEEYDRWPGQAEIPQDAGRYGYRLLELLEKRPAAGGGS